MQKRRAVKVKSKLQKVLNNMGVSRQDLATASGISIYTIRAYCEGRLQPSEERRAHLKKTLERLAGGEP